MFHLICVLTCLCTGLSVQACLWASPPDPGQPLTHRGPAGHTKPTTNSTSSYPILHQAAPLSRSTGGPFCAWPSSPQLVLLLPFLLPLYSTTSSDPQSPSAASSVHPGEGHLLRSRAPGTAQRRPHPRLPRFGQPKIPGPGRGIHQRPSSRALSPAGFALLTHGGPARTEPWIKAQAPHCVPRCPETFHLHPQGVSLPVLPFIIKRTVPRDASFFASPHGGGSKCLPVLPEAHQCSFTRRSEEEGPCLPQHTPSLPVAEHPFSSPTTRFWRITGAHQCADGGQASPGVPDTLREHRPQRGRWLQLPRCSHHLADLGGDLGFFWDWLHSQQPCCEGASQFSSAYARASSGEWLPGWPDRYLPWDYWGGTGGQG